jgi:hypothetical protein
MNRSVRHIGVTHGLFAVVHDSDDNFRSDSPLHFLSSGKLSHAELTKSLVARVSVNYVGFYRVSYLNPK